MDAGKTDSKEGQNLLLQVAVLKTMNVNLKEGRTFYKKIKMPMQEILKHIKVKSNSEV